MIKKTESALLFATAFSELADSCYSQIKFDDRNYIPRERDENGNYIPRRNKEKLPKSERKAASKRNKRNKGKS